MWYDVVALLGVPLKLLSEMLLSKSGANTTILEGRTHFTANVMVRAFVFFAPALFSTRTPWVSIE